jgi:protein-tyrosine phosphatase
LRWPYQTKRVTFGMGMDVTPLPLRSKELRRQEIVLLRPASDAQQIERLEHYTDHPEALFSGVDLASMCGTPRTLRWMICDV